MEKRFDPMTGQPIQPQPVNEQPQMRFDPMTGQPIQPTPAPQPVPTPAPQPAPQPQMQFDPMTGQLVQQTYQQQQYQQQPYQQQPYQPQMMPQPPKKKSKIGFVIGGIVAAVVLIAIVLVAVVKAGVFLSPNDKVLLAVTNTFKDQTMLMEDLDISDIVCSGKYTVGINGSYEGSALDCSYMVTPKSQQIKGSFSTSGIPTVDLDVVVADGKVQAYTSLIDKYLFEYNYEGTNTGYLMQQIPSDQLQMLNDSLKEMENAGNLDDSKAADLAKVLLSDYRSNVKFEKVAEKDIMIDEKTRSCKGYIALIDRQILRRFVDDMKAEVEENNSNVTTNFDELYEAIEEMPDMYVTVYIYKNKLAGINMKPTTEDSDMEILFHGGTTRWQNIELLSDGVSLAQIVGTTSGKSETFELKGNGVTVATITYERTTGLFTINADGTYLSGTINRTGKELSVSLDYFQGLSGTVSFKKGATIEKPTAEKTFDVGNATESECQSILMEIAGSGSALGDLLYGSY